MTAVEAGLWFLGCWCAGAVLFAWVWCSAFGFNAHDGVDE